MKRIFIFLVTCFLLVSFFIPVYACADDDSVYVDAYEILPDGVKDYCDYYIKKQETNG